MTKVTINLFVYISAGPALMTWSERGMSYKSLFPGNCIVE